jgi:hypothetical protein
LSEIRSFLKATEEYWFGFGSATAMGVFRILIGTLAFVNLVLLGMFWDSWFSETGYVPNWIARMWLGPDVPLGLGTEVLVPRMNILSGITDPRITIPFYIATMVFALLTALGLWTRLSTILLAIGVVSLHHRNAAILHGGDTILRVAVLYLAIAPSGRACSLDRLIGLWRGKVSHAPVKVSLWPQRLVSFNVGLLYFTTTWHKYFGNLWRDGTATWYPARLPEFYRFPVPEFFNDFPMVKVSTYGTLAVEFAMGTLVFFQPLRKYVLLAAVLMHSYIEYSMNIPLFSFLMISTYVCFFQGEEVAGWATRVGQRLRRFHVNVYLPQGRRLKPNAVAFLDSTDPFKLIHYLPGDRPEWRAERHDGRPMSPVRATWTRSLGAWPIAWIPGLWGRILNRATEAMPDA